MVFEQPDRFQLRTLTGERFLHSPATKNPGTKSGRRYDVRRICSLLSQWTIALRLFASLKEKKPRGCKIISSTAFATAIVSTFFPVLSRAYHLRRMDGPSRSMAAAAKTPGYCRTCRISCRDGAFRRPKILPSRPVTSRVAEGFYWLGRYLERAMNISKMIQVIETIEMEELPPPKGGSIARSGIGSCRPWNTQQERTAQHGQSDRAVPADARLQ